MDAHQARQVVSHSRVGRLATLTADGRPHMVPCCFVLAATTDPDTTTIYTAVDAKPKSTERLRRIANILADSRVSLLVDHYDEDWSALWWVRLDGRARLVDSRSEEESAKQALIDKYTQYRHVALSGPVIAIDVHTWRTWP